MTPVYHVFRAFLDVLFPPRCVICFAYLPPHKALCDSCRAKTFIESTLVCGECRARLPAAVRAKAGTSQRAPGPRSKCHPHFPYLLGAATRYHDPIPRELILALKFRHVSDAAAELGRFLEAYAARLSLPRKRAVIAPVPLGYWRQRRRGYNQAERIARVLAPQLGLPLRTDLLFRIKATKPQSEARDHAMRKKNVAGCFQADSAKLAGIQTVILIDDVVTSGATFKEAAIALKQAADVQVIALAAAHA